MIVVENIVSEKLHYCRTEFILPSTLMAYVKYSLSSGNFRYSSLKSFSWKFKLECEFSGTTLSDWIFFLQACINNKDMSETKRLPTLDRTERRTTPRKRKIW